MALIAMCVYSTEENKKDECLQKTLDSLKYTVDFSRHRLILSVNSFTDTTKDIFDFYKDIISEIIWNGQNLGTALGINKVWSLRKPGEHCLKMDDDIVIDSQDNWLDILEDAVSRDPLIGQCGLKRSDLIESPSHPDPFYKSELHMLPHNPGERWIVVEKVSHVMGSCVLHSKSLINKVGGLYQGDGNKYGFDDSLMSARSKLAGFYNCFVPGIQIHHIDEGSTPFQQWKEKNATAMMGEYNKVLHEFKTEQRPLYVAL